MPVLWGAEFVTVRLNRLSGRIGSEGKKRRRLSSPGSGSQLIVPGFPLGLGLMRHAIDHDQVRWDRTLDGAGIGAARIDKITIEIPTGKTGEVQVADVIARLARASGVNLGLPAAGLSLSTQGLAGSLTRTLLAEVLGPETSIVLRPGVMVITIDDQILAPERRAEWEDRLRNLGDRASDAARRRQAYGMSARESFRANDPHRPTICLIHGLNSSSAGFVHVIPLLEEAGYGVVVYDYPFNRSLEESCAAFARLGRVSA